jgi:hypothetical protein
MIDMPDGILAQIQAEAASGSERQQFEAVSMMSEIAAEVARQGQEFDAEAKGQRLDPKTLWTEHDGMSVWKGAERCEIILELATGQTARSIAGRRYVLPHERGDFKRHWVAAERRYQGAGDTARLQQLEQLMVDSFSGMMETCSIVTQGKVWNVDGISITYAGRINHKGHSYSIKDSYSKCGQAIQGEREDRRTGVIFPSPWWEKFPACNVASLHATQVEQMRAEARARAANAARVGNQTRSSDTYVPRSSDTYVPREQQRQVGSWLEVGSNTTDATGNDAFALMEIEKKSDMAIATGDNIFFRIYREIQRSGVLSTTLVILQELAQMGFNLVVRVTKGVFSVIKGTLSLVVGVLLAFPRWLLFARDKHKTFGIGVSDDGLKVWPWCWVVPIPHSLSNRRMCR